MSFENPTNGYRDPDTFDIRATVLDITNATRYYKGVVLLTIFLTLALVTVYVYLWPPIYRAEAKLMTESATDTVRDEFYLGWNVFRKDDSITEMELIRSGPVLKEVIEREKLTYDDVYHPFLSHLTYLWQESYVGKKYREVKRWIIPEEEQVVSPEEAELGRTIVDMRKGILIDPVGEANVGILTVKGPSSRVASITNTLLEVYLRKRGERHVQEARSSYDALTEQVIEAERGSKASSERRLDFVREHG
ncbi:MAG: hypothetical protein ACRD88_07460, partial [Terriglobia bacterium]